MRVSVIISNRNDVEMLGVTVRSAIEELSVVPGGGEVVVVDNSDTEIYETLPAILPAGYRRGKVPKIRYFRQDYPCLFTARQEAAQQAKGEYIFCVDAHCIIGHNVIIDLVHFLNRNRSRKIGFAHAPVNWLCQWEGAARHDMKEIFGTWGKLYNYERKMSWKGMPWMCSRDWFLNKLNGYGALAENILAWGGGDMFLGLKTWILGYENWAVPTRPVIHIGPLPTVARKFWKYRKYKVSGGGLPGMGYLVALFTMGGDKLVYDQRFVNFISDRHSIKVDEVAKEAKAMAENERKFIDKNKAMTFDEMWQNKPWENSYKTQKQQLKTDTTKVIKEEDWNLIESLILKHKIKSVVEFGCGLSTLLYKGMNLDITSYETDAKYLDEVRGLLDGVTLQHWDNDCVLNGHKYDLAVVDGESPRINQAKSAKNMANIVVVHDGHKRQCGYRAALEFKDWNEIPNKTRLSRVFVRG